ncbi:Hypothetical predicted protein [Podarcis lilfordi]|uniref:Uncharacterized protein n=1 Tax=Podarcis lilfordi TaxID=74358 RepID=A0AA35LJD7_9SAUR|nr:Hypothetical predicted protein [Podarcis lilfordi]
MPREISACLQNKLLAQSGVGYFINVRLYQTVGHSRQEFFPSGKKAGFANKEGREEFTSKYNQQGWCD